MTITEERPSDEQLFIKNKFYREIDDMNKKLSAFVVSAVEREVELVIDLEVEESKSLDSCNIVIDDVNDRKSDTDSKFEKTG